MGEFAHTAGKYYHDASDKGIQTSEDARFYGISSKMSESFDNKDKDLVIQFSVKHENKIDCGGAYIKLLPDIDQKISEVTPRTRSCSDPISAEVPRELTSSLRTRERIS